ncbi:MAG TPA: Clp protease N-terminal domain-containing protein [Streptosporangiaceae bacterium]|jgi:ATP-dependent Clp protease ATP-binding subunit ClpA
MFERFRKDARAVVVLAQDEARRLGHRSIGTVHLLLGLLNEQDGAGGRALREHGLDLDAMRARVGRLAGLGDPLDGEALATIGIDLDAVRQSVEAAFGAGALEGGRRGHIPFTPQAKKSLELSLRSALALKHKYICSGHVLLGLLRATGDDNLAVEVLADAEVDVDALRDTTTRFIQADAA